MRVVLDTNVLIAIALKGEFSQQILRLGETQVIFLISSDAILAELSKKLFSKFDKSEENVNLFVNKIWSISEIVKTKEKITVVQRDPDDNKILECAVEGKADLIISSDQDLIKLKEFRGIAIIHPKTLNYTFPKYFKTKK